MEAREILFRMQSNGTLLKSLAQTLGVDATLLSKHLHRQRGYSADRPNGSKRYLQEIARAAGVTTSEAFGFDD